MSPIRAGTLAECRREFRHDSALRRGWSQKIAHLLGLKLFLRRLPERRRGAWPFPCREEGPRLRYRRSECSSIFPNDIAKSTASVATFTP